MISCDIWQIIAEKNGYSKIKNLLLKECYLFLEQLPELYNGALERKLDGLTELIAQHFTIESSRSQIKTNVCKLCVLTPILCEVCQGLHGKSFF